MGNLTSLKDGDNNVSTFAYDALNRQTSQTDALGRTATFAYNAVGLLTGTTDRDGRQRTFAYDAANRQTTQLWFDSNGVATQTLTYSFDAAGNELTATNAQGTYTLTYDALNRVSAVQALFSQALTFLYDQAGNRTGVQDSQGGVATSTYDADNRLSSREQSATGLTSPLQENLSYTAAGRLASLTRANVVLGVPVSSGSTSYLYDAAERVTSIQHFSAAGTSLANYTYTYDAASRLTAEGYNGAVTSYSYDNANQLQGDGTNTWTYDAEGNRTNAGYSTGTGNQLTSDGTWSYSYDFEGNLTQKTKGASAETWTYGYDNLNHLVWAEDRATNGGTLLQRLDYKYDAFGNRVEEDVTQGSTTTTTRYALDGWDPAKAGATGQSGWDTWAELSGSNVLQTRYLHGDGIANPVARVDSTGAYWLAADRMGSIRDVLDNTGVVKDHLTYDGWGNVTAETGSSFGGSFKYDGYRWDSYVGMYQTPARFYDPKAGRWTSQDPLGFEAGDSNIYRYVQNAPTDGTDPSGLDGLPGGGAGQIPGGFKATGGPFGSFGGVGNAGGSSGKGSLGGWSVSPGQGSSGGPFGGSGYGGNAGGSSGKGSLGGWSGSPGQGSFGLGTAPSGKSAPSLNSKSASIPANPDGSVILLLPVAGTGTSDKRQEYRVIVLMPLKAASAKENALFAKQNALLDWMNTPAPHPLAALEKENALAKNACRLPPSPAEIERNGELLADEQKKKVFEDRTWELGTNAELKQRQAEQRQFDLFVVNLIPGVVPLKRLFGKAGQL